MPVILHALWLPHTVTSSGDSLALWAESSAPRRVRYPYDNSYSQHSLSLYNTLAGLGFYYSRNYFGQPHYLRLALPSNDRRPLPSVTSPDKPAARKRKRAEPALRAWRVEAALLTPAHALSLLLRLPSETTPATIGPSLRFWEQAARLACAAILRGQFVPYADDDGRGFWQLAFADAELQTDFARLAEAMPPSARALAQPLPSSRDLLAQFIGALGSQFLSQVYAPGRSPFYDPYKYQRRPTEQRPADQWWIDLFPRKDYGANFFSKKANAEAMKALGETVRAWSLPSRKYLASRHRVAFRLEPPPTVEAFDPSLADWRLSFHLQPKDQPETLWAASEVWENPPQPDMPDVLRAGLAQAASLYPPLTGANDDDYPTGLWLNVEQAFEFLEKHSAELNGRGFGVLIPTWWKNRAAKLSTRVSLGRWGDGSGLFGMDSLVNFDWQLAIGDKALALEEFMQLAQSKTSLVQVKGEWMQLDPDQVQAALKLAQRHQKSGGKISLREALGLALTGPAEWEGLEVEDVRVDGWLDETARRLTGRHPIESIPQPDGFNGELRHYQVNGLSWLNFMRQWGFGACLADDMGLGKTVEVLALLQKDLNEDKFGKPVLIVCPTTVVNNWVREAAHFAPQLKCYAHHGPARYKADDFAKAAAEHHLVITSYALLPRDFEFINALEWSGVVLDEAHNIKNPGTKMAQSARQLTARYRFALTGTPVENRLQDLWSILQFLNPGFLGSNESFERDFARPVERDRDPRVMTRLRALTGPFILRRLKTDKTIIQDLPPKNEMKEYCGLTKEQGALYRAVVQESLRQIAAADGIQRRGIILATLTKLKQVCNHPRHLLGDQSALKHRSGKLNRLSEMLEQALAEDDRVLIFTQYAEMGELLREHLSETFGETLYLYGGTPAQKRAEMIDRFQSDGARLFVLSLKAGGAGINLTRANRVFHYDRWWNPAVENQATDRAFRIGQTQAVQVHKLICRGTLEERVDELIERKVALAEQIVGTGESWLTELTTDELRDLLLLRQDAIDD